MDAAPSQLPPTPANPAPGASGTPWPRSAQLTVAFLLGTGTTLLLMYTLGATRWAARPAVVEHGAGLTYRVDLNRAGSAELQQLPGVGPAMVRRMEEYRRSYGPLESVEDLKQVGHVGPATLRRIRPWVRVDEAGVDGTPPLDDHRPLKSARTSKKTASASHPVDLNRATAAQLQQVPWIGPTTARRILEERQKQPFHSVDELRRVRGIGPKKLEKMRPFVTVSSSPLRVAVSD